MGPVQIVASILAAAITAVAIVLLARAVTGIVRVVRLGQPDPERFAAKGTRTRTMLTETLGHTRMLKWSVVGAAHWFVMIAFGALFFTLLEAYGEVVDPKFELPVIGRWSVYGLLTELIAIFGSIGIAVLIGTRLRNRPSQAKKPSRFAGSTMWQGYFVEWVIAAVMVCILTIRAFKAAAGDFPYPTWAAPLSHALGAAVGGTPTGAARTVRVGPRRAAAATPIVRLSPIKPLSPKLLVLSLRDHAYAKAPYLLAGGGKDLTGGEKATQEQLSKVNVLALAEAERPLVGGAEDGGIIDPDVLWSCTTCGACVEQCPVDIEHVDHIVDMRRYQVLIESNFPSEAGVMLRNLENKGNPWGAAPNTRDEWTSNLGFEVPRVGSDVGPGDFEYLFWVGCAGAFEDRAKKTTRAVATLLHEAGVSFAILGEGETCTGDPARRIGNEFVFQMLAQQNVETLNEAGVKKIVATCPHCFNTLANEYGQLGGDFEVVHHTQLLAHLVETGKLTPVQPVDGGVTYHDPCYLGRHNRVFEPPREVLAAAVDGRAVTEMERFKERSFCCGAGGARMWMEERIGKRINVERVEEALGTGAQTVAVGCPFCLTMLGDGVTGKKSIGEASTDVEVVDVATVLLRSLKPE